MVMIFGTWNIRSLYKAGSLMTDYRELSRYRLDSAGMQKVRWEGSGTAPAGDYTFSKERGMIAMNSVQRKGTTRKTETSVILDWSGSGHVQL
jgi:hypothetical protein